MSSAVAAQRAKRERLWALSAGVLLGLGCATGTPPPVRTVEKAPPPARLAWLPADPLAGAALAKAVNERLGLVAIPGAAAGVKAAVSMEVAQLAIECTEPTPTCYTAVGQSLGADEMLWAELSPGSSATQEIRVALLLYDVRAGVAPRRLERTFDGAEAARAGVAALVDSFKSGNQAGSQPR
jgi:hypothetical protein